MEVKFSIYLNRHVFVMYSPIFTREATFLTTFLPSYPPALSEKSFSKRKEFAPEDAYFFLLGRPSFQNGRKTFQTDLPPLIVILFSLNYLISRVYTANGLSCLNYLFYSLHFIFSGCHCSINQFSSNRELVKYRSIWHM